MSLAISAEPDSPCASWMPAPVEPVVTHLDTTPNRYFWNGGATTDGRGDLVFSMGTDCCTSFVTPSIDGGVQFVAESWSAVPQPGGFLFQNANQGACLICDSWLSAWPDGGTVYTGNGYSFSTNCNFAARAEGDGAYVSCTGPTNQSTPPTLSFSRYDGALAQLWSIAGDGNSLVAADASDKLIEANSSGQWRWVDESLTPLTEWFAGGRNLSALIGGGFLDSSGRVIPSGRAPEAAPDWLASATGLSIVLGGRAYALGGNDCTLEIRQPSGTLCGKVTIENCRAPPWPGADGSITILADPEIGAKSTGTLVSWPNVLR